MLISGLVIGLHCMNVAGEAQNDVEPCFADAVYISQPPISTWFQLVPSTTSICTINSGAFMRTYTVVKIAQNVQTIRYVENLDIVK